jgi:hypothetical protein
MYQEGTYQPVYVELLESLENFNSQLATGFSYDTPTAATPTEALVGSAEPVSTN